MGKKKSLKIVLPIIMVAAVVSGFFIVKSISDKQSDESIYYGTVEADEINISTEIGGKITAIKLKEGSSVKPGDLVALIDSDEDSLKLQDAEISIENAENELGKIQDGSRSEEIKAQEAVVKQSEALIQQGESAVEMAQNNVNSAQTNYDYKKKIYDDAATLYQSGSDSKYNMDAAKNQLDNASNTLENSKDSLQSTQAQLNNYKAQLDGASQKLNLLVNGATERDKDAAEYSVERAKNDYEISKVELDKSKVTAFTKGVIESVNYREGEYVTPGSSIATLLDNENMWVKIYVPEKILPNIKLNEDITMKSDFLKNKIIKGKITYISPEAEFTPMNIVTKQDRMKLVYEVKVKILDNLESIKPGMLFDVNIK